MTLAKGVTVWDGNKKYKGECPDKVAEKLGLKKQASQQEKKSDK